MLADKLWAKYENDILHTDGDTACAAFLAAIKEAMEAVREKAVRECENSNKEIQDHMAYIVDANSDCAAAIKQMELP